MLGKWKDQDTNAINYSPNASVSSLCVYDHIDSWTVINEKFHDSTFTTINGVIYDYLQISQTTNTPTGLIDPVQISFLQNRVVNSIYLDGTSFNGNWTISNDNLTFELNDTTLTMEIDIVNSNVLRLISNSQIYIVVDSVNSLESTKVMKRKTQRRVLEFSRN